MLVAGVALPLAPAALHTPAVRRRDVVGAVVESQPFGGHGLSGNGAKAGSEHYLEQFVARKVVCEDTTAAGGNLELMRTTG